MKNGNPWIVPVFVMCCITAPLSARGADQPSAEGRAGGSAEGGPERGYQLLFGGLEDLNSVASLGVNGYAFLSDLYTFGIGPHLPPGIEGIADMVWQTWWSFMLTIWPHEFGHWTRAREIGGEFVFEKFGIPWPDARMDLPDDVDLFSETLTSTGGFEINSLMRLFILEDLYFRGTGSPSLLIHSFIQGVYYPLYAWVVAQAVNGGWMDPEDPDTWITTMGDPVESSLLTYRNYTGNPVPAAGETVDTELVSYYRECLVMSLVWTVLDPGIYQGLGLVGSRDGSGMIEPFMFGGDRFSWIYGTLFTATPLGYELSLLNHFRIRGRYGLLTLRYGRPFLNFGAGVSVPGLLETSAVRVGAGADYWYQAPFGHGIAVRITTGIEPPGPVGFRFTAGWKSEGYLLGMPVDDSLYLQGGIVFHVSWPAR